MGAAGSAASVDFFGLAIKSNDGASFDAHGQRPGERIDRIPVSTGVNLGYQATPLSEGSSRAYELHYDAYSARCDDCTLTLWFLSSTATNGEGVGYEQLPGAARALLSRSPTTAPISGARGHPLKR